MRAIAEVSARSVRTIRHLVTGVGAPTADWRDAAASAAQVSPSKADKLAELIAACAIAPTGNRSETDFAACCYAVRNGIAKEDVWSQLEHVGKFAEQGRRYFEVTWANAEYDVRATTCAELQRRSPSLVATESPSETLDPESAGQEEPTRPTIQVDSRSTPVSITMGHITEQLLTAGHCFNRVEQLVVVRDQQFHRFSRRPSWLVC